MRALFGLALATTVGGIAVAAGGDRAGKVIRIDQPVAREVHVPAGAFWMGITDEDENIVHAQCNEMFEFMETSFLGARQQDVCTNYAEELERMKQRRVFLSAFAIDRYEVTVADYRSCITAGMCNLDPQIG